MCAGEAGGPSLAQGIFGALGALFVAFDGEGDRRRVFDEFLVLLWMS